jgi:hypothetical protein
MIQFNIVFDDAGQQDAWFKLVRNLRRCIRTTIRSASASSCMSMKTCRMPEEGLKVHRFAGVLPDQLLTEASRHRDAVVPADQRAVMRCFGDDLAGFVHDVSHSRIASTAPGAPMLARCGPNLIDDPPGLW